MNLALFDFDGTITDADMYTTFLHYSGSMCRDMIGHLLLAPCFLMYKLGYLSARKMRILASYAAFSQRKYDELNHIGLEFSRKMIPLYLRDCAPERIDWHQKNGDEVVVVSASIDIYLKHWCQAYGLSLICSELEVRDGRLSGCYLAGDCSGEAKAKKVRECFDLTSYECIYAYGDSAEDLDMLKLADEQYMNWAKVSVQ
ncbi:HAD-IB family hydrolase [Shewanella sp. VB17]|uniref:HAD-IB family hydrolase n=1 Tax=Shewanella sp. VB17 TaxID=2739432 RepID=UPI0015639894|nr:HAD-IB family hydrolase [Shewanella sp. VB17]NRD74395.1 HAD-IB family hydrolase [Shewanella sp. VB17]